MDIFKFELTPKEQRDIKFLLASVASEIALQFLNDVEQDFETAQTISEVSDIAISSNYELHKILTKLVANTKEKDLPITQIEKLRSIVASLVNKIMIKRVETLNVSSTSNDTSEHCESVSS